MSKEKYKEYKIAEKDRDLFAAMLARVVSVTNFEIDEVDAFEIIQEWLTHNKIDHSTMLDLGAILRHELLFDEHFHRWQ